MEYKRLLYFERRNTGDRKVFLIRFLRFHHTFVPPYSGVLPTYDKRKIKQILHTYTVLLHFIMLF